MHNAKNVPVFLYVVNMLIFQIKIIISREKWFNDVATFSFFENAKKIKEDGLSRLP